MRTIFWGLLFAWLHVNLNLGNSTIELLLAFVGWYLLLKGVRELPPCKETGELEWPLRVLIVLTAAEWALHALALGGLPFVGGAIELLGVLCMLYVTWMLVRIVETVGESMSCPMPVDSLRACWTAMAVCTACGWMLGWSVVFFSLAAMLAVGVALAGFAAMIVFLVFLWKAVRAYETAQASPVELLPPGSGEE